MLTDEKIKAYTKRIMMARLRILNDYGFYGAMLMHMKFKLDPECTTAYTDSEVIAFSPEFMDNLSDSELEFILMHEVMHVVLKHCSRGLNYDSFIFNVACDIVVNSNILKTKNLNLDAITLRCEGAPAMHLAPDNNEGYLYTAEEVYEMLVKAGKKKSGKSGKKGKSTKAGTAPGDNDDPGDSGSFDDHSKWGTKPKRDEEIDTAIISAIESANKKQNSSGVGSVPYGALRIFKDLTKPKINWREILNEFITVDINDYSFTPPDRRYDSPFFLPDFNVPDESISDLLFLIDTSGSMSDADITEVYSEIKGAMDQFNNKLKCKVGFFDEEVYEPCEVENVEDLLKLRPRGGGGTSFYAAFKYAASLAEQPKMLIMLTDGECEFPNEEMLHDIPLLWVFNKPVKAPYGRVAILRDGDI